MAEVSHFVADDARLQVSVPYLAAEPAVAVQDDAAEFVYVEPAADLSSLAMSAPAPQPIAMRISSAASEATTVAAPVDQSSFRLQASGAAVPADRSSFGLQSSGVAGSAQASVGLPDEYGSDWSSVLAYEFRVEVTSASELGAPEYRLGDVASSFVGNGQLSAYVEVTLGARTLKTSAGTSCGRDVEFSGEKMLFSFSGEPAVAVRVLDRRGVQAMIRGDPLIGEGSLQLLPDLRDCKQRMDVVDITRDGKPVGSVQLRYQMLALYDEAVVGGAVAQDAPTSWTAVSASQ